MIMHESACRSKPRAGRAVPPRPAPRSAGQDGLPLGFAQPAPHPVGFAGLQGVLRTCLDHGTSRADGLGSCLTSRTRRASLPFGVEEELGALPTAGAVKLPLPLLGTGAWKSSDVGHRPEPPLSTMGGWRRSYTVVPRHMLFNIENHSARSRSEPVRRQVVGTVAESHHERCDPLPGPGGAQSAVHRCRGCPAAGNRARDPAYMEPPVRARSSRPCFRYPPQVRPTRPGSAGVHVPSHAGWDRAGRGGPHGQERASRRPAGAAVAGTASTGRGRTTFRSRLRAVGRA